MLSVLVLDLLYGQEVNLSELLKTASRQRELPIRRLAVLRKFAPLREGRLKQIDEYNVFIASFAKLEEEYIEFAQNFRKRKDDVFIVFVVDKEVDISTCVRPSVRPSGILFIPLEPSRIFQTIKEIHLEYQRTTEREAAPVFTVKSGGAYFTINTGDIYFFEAQGKKIAAKTRGQEISFYSSFDSVLEQLPDWFIRCHKGYVVNTKQITRTSFTEMTLTLKDKSVIPISRTYRNQVRVLLEPKEGLL